MATYTVSIPITGIAWISVEAESKKDAIEKAWDSVDSGLEPEVTWEYTHRVCTGNVCHAMQNKIEVEEDE